MNVGTFYDPLLEHSPEVFDSFVLIRIGTPNLISNNGYR
jgi:hypothetical protein